MENVIINVTIMIDSLSDPHLTLLFSFLSISYLAHIKEFFQRSNLVRLFLVLIK